METRSVSVQWSVICLSLFLLVILTFENYNIILIIYTPATDQLQPQLWQQHPTPF